MHRHASRADADLSGDGAPDAVRLDFDGDGRVNEALWDSDGDGAADRAVLDLDDDGRPEARFTDPSGRGLWDGHDGLLPVPHLPASGAALPATGRGRELRWGDVRGRDAVAAVELDTDGDGVADGARVEADHDASTVELVCDLDGDGRAEQLLVDRDHDGSFESAYLPSAGPGSGSARWDVLLADTDGDAVVDTSLSEGAQGWVPP